MSVSDENIQIRLGLAERKSKELKKVNKKLQGEIVRLNGRIKELDRKANDSDSYQEQEIRKRQEEFSNVYREKRALEWDNQRLESQQNELQAQNRRIREQLHDKVTKKKFAFSMAIAAFGALLVGLTVAFSISFSLEKWWQWEHIIGALVIPFIFLGLCAFFIGDIEIPVRVCEVLIFLLAIANVGLALGLKDGYKIIAYWVCGYSLASPIISILLAGFNEITSGLAGFGWFVSFTMIFFVAFLI